MLRRGPAQNRTFTQEDPIGYAGGVNLYAYVGNNPLSHSDPFGLCPGCDQDNPYSIKVNGRELNPGGFVLKNALVREDVAALYSGIAAELGHENFTFQVTGGDRYADSQGNHRSATDGSIVQGSSRTSPHLDSRGARAVDLRIGGVSDQTVDKVIRTRTEFLPANTQRGYADRHTHVALPNRPAYYAKPEEPLL